MDTVVTALVLPEPTFTVFSFSLKFAVVEDRHQRRLFGSLTRRRRHSIVQNMGYGGEISRPLPPRPPSLRGSS